MFQPFAHQYLAEGERIAREADAMEPRSTNLDIYRWLVDSRMMPVNLTEAHQATDTRAEQDWEVVANSFEDLADRLGC